MNPDFVKLGTAMFSPDRHITFVFTVEDTIDLYAQALKAGHWSTDCFRESLSGEEQSKAEQLATAKTA